MDAAGSEVEVEAVLAFLPGHGDPLPEDFADVLEGAFAPFGHVLEADGVAAVDGRHHDVEEREGTHQDPQER